MQSVASLANSSSRACQNCARAKAKCVPSDSGEHCGRCSRLKRECVFPPKNTRKRRSPNSIKSTAQLEQKIESLVTLLSATQGTVLPIKSPEEAPVELPQQEQEDVRRADHRPAFSWTVDPSPKKHSSWDTQLPLHCCPQVQPSVTSAESTPFSSALASMATPASTLSNISTPSIDLNFDNADHLLTVYKKHYEPDFPLMLLPPNITAQELKATRPWLACVISMVASHGNRIQQLRMAKEIIMEVAAALLIRCEKSLDMLEGLIVFNLWQYYYSPMSPQYQSAAVMQLAISVMLDLGLNHNDGPDIMLETFKPVTDTIAEKQRSLAETRAYVSCFLIASTASCSFRKPDSLEYNADFEYACQSLAEGPEFDSDLILAFAVRCQALASSINRRVTIRGACASDNKAPPSMHASSAQADLQRFFKALPSELQEHSLVRRTYHFAEISIYEPSLNRSLFPLNLNSVRLDMMYACLTSAKNLLDHSLAMPRSSYYGLSLISLSQLGYALSSVSKLSMIEVPGWDLTHVRSTVNILQYFEDFISILSQVGAQLDNSQPAPSKISFATGCSRAMGRVKGWYEARLAAEEEKKRQEQRGVDDIMSGENFDYWDEAFFNFNGDWEMMGDFMPQ